MSPKLYYNEEREPDLPPSNAVFLCNVPAPVRHHPNIMQSFHPSIFHSSTVIAGPEGLRRPFRRISSLKEKDRVTTPSGQSGTWRRSLPVPNLESTTGPSSESRQSAQPGEQEEPSSPEA
jgi:hypothetical protein